MTAGFLFLAVGLNLGAALLSLWRRAVTPDGAIAGFVVGSAILLVGGFFYWTMLILFFVTASVVSRIGKARKQQLTAMHQKGNRRDWIQVLANGGVAGVAVVLLGLTHHPAFGVAAAAAFASANADTWASELGVLSERAPRSITTWRQLQPGTSGGVSVTGTLASAVGAGIIAAWFGAAIAIGGGVALGHATGALGHVAGAALLVLSAGICGSAVDSLLGATVQAQYTTDQGRRTERPTTDGVQNQLVRGHAFINNDVVNFLSSAVVATTAGLVVLVL